MREVAPADEGVRLDQFVGGLAEVGSRSQAAQLIDAGCVLVDGESRPKSYRVVAAQQVSVRPLAERTEGPEPEDLPVSVRYEDEWLLVVDKPAGMVVHPSRGHERGTLVNALRAHGISGGDVERPGIVHRLDRDTSGLLVIAKDVGVHRTLQQMIRERVVERYYLALVHGHPPTESGTIDAPVGRDPRHRMSMAVGGVAPRSAVTHFWVLEEVPGFALVRVRLETGRTHQIRVHFAAIGHPVAGDPTYSGKDVLGIRRQFLHSTELAFVHPVTGVPVRVVSPLPSDLAAVLEQARLRTGR